MEGNNYRFLRTSGRIFDILGWVSLVVGAVVTVVILIGGGGPDSPRAAGIIGILLGGIYFLIFKTISGVIRLLLDIESRMKP